MKENYDISFELVIGHEGGYTTNPKDRGNWTTGKIGVGVNKGTKYGVSAMAYPSLDIKNLTLDQAKEIYRKDYWAKVAGDELPHGLDYLTFDCAINHGPQRAVKLLQEAVGSNPDGALGPKTLAAVRAADGRSAIIKMGTERDEFFDDINNKEFEDGWRKRAFEVSFNAYDLWLARQ